MARGGAPSGLARRRHAQEGARIGLSSGRVQVHRLDWEQESADCCDVRPVLRSKVIAEGAAQEAGGYLDAPFADSAPRAAKVGRLPESG